MSVRVQVTCDAPGGCTAIVVELGDDDIAAHTAVIAESTRRGWLVSLDRGDSNRDYCAAHRRFAYR